MSTPSGDAVAVVLEFVARINRGDATGLVELMSEDHRFVDATGTSFGRKEMEGGWRETFSFFPDYSIEVEQTIACGGQVAVFGWASGTFAGPAPVADSAAWRVASSWRATVAGDRVTEWRVYCDVEPMLRSMGMDRARTEAADATRDSLVRYVILLTRTGPEPYSGELVRAHVAHLQRLDAQGVLQLCGPFPANAGGMVMLRVDSEERAADIARSDPFVVSGASVFEVRKLLLACRANGYLLG